VNIIFTSIRTQKLTQIPNASSLYLLERATGGLPERMDLADAERLWQDRKRIGNGVGRGPLWNSVGRSYRGQGLRIQFR